MLTVRATTDEDIEDVLALVRAAFEPEGAGAGDSVAKLVAALRHDPDYIPELDLVAELDGRLAGYILFSRATIGDAETPAVLLAPLAVAPEAQGRGVGSLLIDEGLALAEELGYGVGLVLGHPGYYIRYGFLPASVYGVAAPRPVPDEAWMLTELKENGAAEAGGTVRLASVFDADEYW
jgi:predicted N-acetyltransferase YhbS